MGDRTVKALLIYPPVTDPTSGYHSLSYLECYARAHGHTAITIRDANVEAVDYMAQPAQVEALLDRARQLYRDLGGMERLNGEDQIAYYHAWLSRTLRPEDLQEAFRVLRDPEDFYRYPLYRRAAGTVMRWIRCLSLLGFPGQFANGFRVEPRGWANLNMSGDLTDPQVLWRLNQPFAPYYERVLLPELAASDYRLVGMNVTYTSQLPFALYLLGEIRKVMPQAFLVLGGTEVSDVWKYGSPDRFRQIFHEADACVVGEGESAFVHLLDSLAAGEMPQAAPNLILNTRLNAGEALLPFRVHYEKVEGLPTPDYTQLPWDKYLSPELFVYYSPSRGCYWNRCTFCDYGLNFGSPTSPWRADPVAKIVRDLREITRQARFVYFSVDVMAPATLLKLAERIVEEGIQVRWSAEIRLETYWSRQRCELLKQSGCVAVSVGFESGNPRVLQLIDKGTKPDEIAVTIRNFTEAGIGVQMMGFTGFPSETEAEAFDSVNFLREYRCFWTFGGLGTFMLTPGAIVAREPERFGIEDVRPFAGEDVVRDLRYRDPVAEAARVRDPEWEARLRAAKRALTVAPFGRPFLGGVDTPHTLFYHDRYGTRILATIDEQVNQMGQACDSTPTALNGQIIREDHGYSPTRLLRGVDGLHRAALAEGRALSHRELTDLLRRQETARGPEGSVWFLRHDGSSVKLTPALTRLLEAVEATGAFPVGQDGLVRQALEHRMLAPY